VKHITSGGFSLRHGHPERVSHFRIDNGGGFSDAAVRRGQAMGQQLQIWRPGDGETLWLSLLIESMEEASRPEIRSRPCDTSILLALSAKLARPASPYPFGVSKFSLRN
jgi:hypothetical protein